MRKITENMLHAIRHGNEWKQSNTATRHGIRDSRQGLVVYLHGNEIAFIPSDENAPIRISLAGFDTQTTRNRLNAIAFEICGCWIGRVKGETRVTFPRYKHTSGQGSCALAAHGWVTLNRKHINARHAA